MVYPFGNWRSSVVGIKILKEKSNTHLKIGVVLSFIRVSTRTKLVYPFGKWCSSVVGIKIMDDKSSTHLKIGVVL